MVAAILNIPHYHQYSTTDLYIYHLPTTTGK